MLLATVSLDGNVQLKDNIQADAGCSTQRGKYGGGDGREAKFEKIREKPLINVNRLETSIKVKGYLVSNFINYY